MNEENNPDEVCLVFYLECLLTRRGWKNSNWGKFCIYYQINIILKIIRIY